MSDWTGSPKLRHLLEPSVSDFPGNLALYARNLSTEDEIGFQQDVVMPTASVIKVGIMAELYRQAEQESLDLKERVTVSEDAVKGGTGVLKELQAGLQPTLFDLCRLMIIVSDNTATHLLVERLGIDRINASLRAWKLQQTHLIFGDGDIRNYALSTAREMAQLMELIATDQIVSPPACEAMRDHLSRQQHLEQMGRFLPIDQYAYKSPDSVKLMNKIGCSTGMRADAAIIDTGEQLLVVAATNEGSTDASYRLDHEGNIVNGRIAQICVEYWSNSRSCR